MARNPLAYLKHRLSAAIDWRVTQEFDKERDLIRTTNHSMVDASAQLSDQLATLTRLVQSLEARIDLMEKKNT
jgi:hypothetical protein